MDIKNFTFCAPKTGTKLLIFGAIHGNETCGTTAINKVISQIKKGEIKLLTGKVTFIPTCNTKAYKQNKRYIDEDLNRTITKHNNTKTNEQKIANELTKFIDDCDYLLDIHSMTSESNPCLFEEPKTTTIKHKNFLKAQNIELTLIGWEQLYKSQNTALSTENYANKKNKIAITVECGQHNSPKAPEVAYNCIINSLKHLNIIKGDKNKANIKNKRVLLTDIIYKQCENAEFIKDWPNMAKIKKGEIIAKSPTKNYISPKDGYLIMPSKQAQLNTEWYYIGIDENKSS